MDISTHVAQNNKTRLVKLFLISFVSLFFELLFIRWIPDAVHILSFFGNFTLLAVFLGLGIGLALPVKEQDENKILRKIIVNIFLLSVVIIFFDMLKFGVAYSYEYAFNEDYLGADLRINIYFLISLFICLCIYAFIPIGYMINLLFRRQKPLTAYSVNIGGSLAGIAAFSAASYLSAPPWIWMLTGLIFLFSFAKSKQKYALVSFLLVLIIFASNYIVEKKYDFKKIWSPYYCLRFKQYNSDFCIITIGNNFLLSGLNMYSGDEKQRDIRFYYEFPYIFKKTPQDVLVFGSGMGNDVAVALKNGAKHIDAVEIDPKIVELGKKYHPLKPYSDPRVSVIVDDARSYSKKTNKKYDIILFATLDSHGLFSQLSSLKMENYVYTLESFKDAKKLLKKDGIIYVNTGFAGYVPINYRIYKCLADTFGAPPLFYIYRNQIMMYLSGNFDSKKEKTIDFSKASYVKMKFNPEAVKKEFPGAFILPTDNWPHLFLKENKIPREYGFALAILFIISAVFVGFYFNKAKNLNPFYFFLGAGFMLLETKSITEMGLVFGATWIVNSVVIASILLVILLANFFLMRYEKFDKTYAAYALLGIAIAAAYLFPLSSLNVNNIYIKLFLSVVFISLPVFFAAIIFGAAFRKAGDKSTIYLASNMLGSVFGGILEYSSMIYGLKFLYVFVFALYLVSMLSMINEGKKIKSMI